MYMLYDIMHVVFKYMYVQKYRNTELPAEMHTCRNATYIYTYLSKNKRACMHTYIHTHIHTYIHTHTHTYTHTYMHTYGRTLCMTCAL
jgi:hypothetical protein